MRPEEIRHIKAQIDRLYADAKRHNAIADELNAQAQLMTANLSKRKSNAG